ncbi:MAG: dethiobiotin synthase, partial [Planctomycetaceae bacterium]|nr:dethiobiotin synthase [Planctomycetaceae bacterium]
MPVRFAPLMTGDRDNRTIFPSFYRNGLFPMKGLFITGTDTSVGKTWLTSRLVFHLRQTGIPVGAFKPACSGARPTTTGQDPIWEDVEGLHQAVQEAFPRERICPLRFLAPLAPPMAAQAESRSVSVEIIRET